MAASYPSSLPVKDAAGANLSSNPHSTLHDDMYDEIVALATELGTLPKGTAATVKARLDALPLGEIGRYESSAGLALGSQDSATWVDATGYSVTFTAASGRLYKVTGAAQIYGSASMRAILAIRNGSTVLARCGQGVLTTGGLNDTGFHVQYIGTFTPGSVTVKLSTTATTNEQLWFAAAHAFIVVEDIGAS